MSEFSESVLIADCIAGNEQAWALFVERYRGFLQTAALKICRDPAQADELSERVIVKLYQGNKLSQYDRRGSFKAWLHAVMIREFIDWQRAEKRKKQVALDDNVTSLAAVEESTSRCLQYFQRPFLEEASSWIRNTLSSLPSDEAALVNLYYYQEKTLAEIAALLNVHESTISRRHRRIVETLQTALNRFLSRDKRLSPSAIGEFWERCAPFLSASLARFREAHAWLP